MASKPKAQSKSRTYPCLIKTKAKRLAATGADILFALRLLSRHSLITSL